jgi:uncharacterized protein YecE (DUF72 family)
VLIQIGLSGWGDHDDLYVHLAKADRNKLKTYSGHFPIVELDSSFYAIQPEHNYLKWIDETPEDFSFIVKAYQGMTGHLRGNNPYKSAGEMFAKFKASIEPLKASGKLKVVLFQYPPWFDCTKESVRTLRYTKRAMEGTPVALEFRNQTWFQPGLQQKTLKFMEDEGWIHSICDEPQAGIGSVPTILHATDPQLTLVRLHGRNAGGWNNTGDANWRDVRYLYRYNQEELVEWQRNIEQLQEMTKDICVIFNNNSGGDAAANAKQLMDILGIHYEGRESGIIPLF